MHTQTEDTVVIKRTKELCQTILDQPEVRDMRRRIESFMADDEARSQYDALVAKGQALQQQQHAGLPLDQNEIKAFEDLRSDFLGKPVAQSFLDAQEEMQKLQQSVAKYVSKTFELGRIPEESDLEDGGCGHGCGCHH
jgi:cell fate (sporulation/competence/biofilm development) regulator YlbF (YheA/YmcA/DUF963 family)